MASAMALLSEWFEGLRWLGVAYLVYLGVRQWRAAPVALGDLPVPEVSRARLYWTGVIVTATNPKDACLLRRLLPPVHRPRPRPRPTDRAALRHLPGGADPDRRGLRVARRAGPWLASRARARLRNRVTGGLMIGAGLGMALARRS